MSIVGKKKSKILFPHLCSVVQSVHAHLGPALAPRGVGQEVRVRRRGVRHREHVRAEVGPAHSDQAVVGERTSGGMRVVRWIGCHHFAYDEVSVVVAGLEEEGDHVAVVARHAGKVLF